MRSWCRDHCITRSCVRSALSIYRHVWHTLTQWPCPSSNHWLGITCSTRKSTLTTHLKLKICLLRDGESYSHSSNIKCNTQFCSKKYYNTCVKPTIEAEVEVSEGHSTKLAYRIFQQNHRTYVWKWSESFKERLMWNEMKSIWTTWWNTRGYSMGLKTCWTLKVFSWVSVHILFLSQYCPSVSLEMWLDSWNIFRSHGYEVWSGCFNLAGTVVLKWTATRCSTT